MGHILEFILAFTGTLAATLTIMDAICTSVGA